MTPANASDFRATRVERYLFDKSDTFGYLAVRVFGAEAQTRGAGPSDGEGLDKEG